MTLTIIIAIVAFLVITLVLVGLLLFAKAKLTTSGDVTIDINGGEKVLIAESGGTLLSTLANNNVFLPSACGGGGSCGMCKCQVLEGGGELLPMHKAATWAAFTLADYPDAVVEILDWPGTAVRVVSKSRQSIIDVSDIIREAWVGYDDAANGIASHDADGNRQSALSPSAIITERGYEMSLIFRNNAISDEYPEGIFHAHPEYWPVKQEPIGLIEAQGLFILPGRLVDQLGIVEEALAEGRDLPDEVSEFSLEWGELAETLAGNHDREAIRQAVHDELGSVCYRILGNTAVFKQKATTQTFLESLGFAAR